MDRVEVAQLVMGLFDRGRTWDYVEMESELGIDFALIVDVCSELEAAGELQVVDDSPSGEGYYLNAFSYHGSLSLSKADCP